MSFIHKFRGGILAIGGFMGTKVSSVAGLNVASTFSVRDVSVSNAASLATLNGAITWRGVTTILSGQTTAVVSNAALAVKSGFPAVLTGITNIASHQDTILSVGSIVDGTSFTATATKATSVDFDVSYIIVV